MNINEILKNLGLNTEFILSLLNDDVLSSVAEIFGIDERLLIAAVKFAPLILSGETDLKSLIPTLLPTVLSYFASLKNAPEKENPKKEHAFFGDNSEIIKDFKEHAGEAFSPLELYLQSDNAS